MKFANETARVAFSHAAGNEEGMNDDSFAHDAFAALSGCGDEAQMKACVERIVHGSFRLDAFHYGLRFVDTSGKSTDFVLTNYGDDWLSLPREHGQAVPDPGLLHALTRVTPLLWSDIVHADTDADALAFVNAARGKGLECGVTIPLHGPGPDVLATFSVVIDTRRTAPEQAWPHLRRALPHLCLFALHVHSAVFELLNRPPSPPVRLTRRERECLRWVVAGKSTWEIAQILGISEHGVTHHVRNVMRKFNCTSRHVAAARASAQRLI
jgi:LuxR family quorum-sensing transcriptional regulator LasR